jgi:hypothetical protein
LHGAFGTRDVIVAEQTSHCTCARFFLVFSILSSFAWAGVAQKLVEGNLHTHSLWSDGDDYPEMIAGWAETAWLSFSGILRPQYPGRSRAMDFD